MTAIRVGLLFLAVCSIVLTLAWFIMWLAGIMSGLFPLFGFIGFMAFGTVFIGTFAGDDKKESK